MPCGIFLDEIEGEEVLAIKTRPNCQTKGSITLEELAGALEPYLDGGDIQTLFLPAQLTPPADPAEEGLILFSDSDGDFGWVSSDGFYRVFSGNPTGNHTYLLPDADGTLVLTSQLGSYVPKAGATDITGDLVSNNASNLGSLAAPWTLISGKDISAIHGSVTGTGLASIPINGLFSQTDGTGFGNVQMRRVGANTSASSIISIKSRSADGTAYGTLVTGDNLFSLDLYSDNGTALQSSGGIYFRAEDVTGTVVTSVMTVVTRTTGGTLAQRLKMASNGAVIVGQATTSTATGLLVGSSLTSIFTGLSTFSLDGQSVVFGTGANTSVYTSFATNRGYMGYDGSDMILQGGATKGIKLTYNNGTFGSGSIGVHIDGATGNMGIAGLSNASWKLYVNTGNSYFAGNINSNAGALQFAGNSALTHSGGSLYHYAAAGGHLFLSSLGGTTQATLTSNGLIVGTGSLVATAVLQADSTTRGFLPPRLTNAQMTTLSGNTPAAGLQIWNTDRKGYMEYKDSTLGFKQFANVPDLIATSAGTVAMQVYNTNYRFQGTTSTFTLPAITGSENVRYTVINAGSGNIILNANAGGNDIFDAGVLKNTITIAPGEVFVIHNDSVKFAIIP